MTSNPPPTPPRTRVRRSPLPALGLTVLVALGAVAGATAVFAGRTQTLATDLTTQLNTAASATGMVTVTQTAYRRGLTSSTQTMTLSVQPQGGEKPLDVILTNRIQHGPLPGLRGVGQAIVDTDITFGDPQVQAAYVKAFPNRKPTLHTVVGLGGSTDTTMDVPAGSVNDGGTTVTWQAAGGTVTVAGPVTTTRMTWPGLTLLAPDGGATVTGLTVDGTARRSGTAGTLATGAGTLTVGKVSVTGDGETLDVTGLKVRSDTTETGGFYSSAVKYDAAAVTAAGQTWTDLQLHLGMDHLAGAPLERIAAVLRDAQRSAGTAAAAAGPDLTDVQLRQLREDVLAVLKGEPVLRLDRLSVRRPAGDVTMTGQLGVPGAATVDADQLAQLADAPATVARLLAVTLDMQGAEAAVADLAGTLGAAGDGVAQDLGALVDAGYVTRSGGQLRTTLRVQDGAVTLNGQPLGR